MLPTFLIPGAAKSGSTSLYWFLSQHPDVFMSHPKEPAYFSVEYEKGTDYYLRKYFRGYGGQREVGEAAVRNLYLPYVPRRIAETLPHARFLVLVRNPVERAFSHYCYEIGRGTFRMSFEQALRKDLRRVESGLSFTDPEEYARARDRYGRLPDYPMCLDSGYYAAQIERYLNLFGKERIKIIFFEDFVNRTQETLDGVFDFLNLSRVELDDLSPRNQPTQWFVHIFFRTVGRIPGIGLFPGGWREAAKSVIASSFTASKPNLAPETRAWLADHYRPHNRKLEELTGRDLSHWG